MNTSPSSKTPPTHPQHFQQLPHTHFPPSRNLFIPIALRTLEKTTGVYPPKANPRRNSPPAGMAVGCRTLIFRGCGFNSTPPTLIRRARPCSQPGAPPSAFRGWGFKFHPAEIDPPRPLTFAKRDPLSALQNRNQPRWPPTLFPSRLRHSRQISPRSPDTPVPVRPFTLCPHVQFSLSDSLAPT